MVQHLSMDVDEVPDWELEEMWLDLEQKQVGQTPFSDTAEDKEDNVIPINSGRQMSWLVAAAVSALLLVSGVLLVQQWQQQATKVYMTQAKERMFLLLPDSSSVILNANSTLTLPVNWSADKDRVVQLEGQAYFSVTHKQNNQRFVVQTKDGLEVEVLGTEFSVSNKENKKQVVLEAGKVQLNITQNGQQQELIMAPGDLVEADQAAGIVQKQVNTALYTAWKNEKLILEDISLAQVAQVLEHSYGYKVLFKNAALKSERITAYLDKNSPEHILSTLSETLQVEINKEDKLVTIN